MKLVPNAISKVISRQALISKKNAPQILFGAGVVGSVASTVLACRATLKLHEVLDEIENDVKIAKDLDDVRYSEQDRKKDLTLIYARSIGKMGRLYAPSILLGAASIGALTKSHNMLNERNVAVTAAYAAVDKAFREYRERVVEKYGEEQDQEFRYDTEEVTVINEKGKKSTVVRAGPNAHSMYARFFDPYSTSWSKEPEYNLIFLRCQQNWANDLLKARGHVFLNEVYDMLGLSRSNAGAVVGWVVSDEGDNYVDFGIFDPNNENAREFVNGREGSILLDFNVDGIIYDKIDDNRERIAWQS